MTKSKIIKDSVHNYIEIEEPFFKIIDTAGFQRLKNVKQTSYSSLYPSSTHDRFTHSLGTYYLGKTVIKYIDRKDNHHCAWEKGYEPETRVFTA